MNVQGSCISYDYLRKVKTKYIDIFNLCERAIVLVGSKPVSGNIYFGGIIFLLIIQSFKIKGIVDRSLNNNICKNILFDFRTSKAH